MNKFRIILIMFLFSVNCNAIMYSIRGSVNFDNKLLRDTVYDTINSNKQYCIADDVLVKYDVAVGTITADYSLVFYFNIDIENRRNTLENAIKNLSDSRVKSPSFIEVWDSHNDGIPGLCQPDVLLRIYKK